MAIILWQRHKKCSHDRPEYDRAFKVCSCVIPADGLLPGHAGYNCLSTGTRVMADAERMVFLAKELGSWDKARNALGAAYCSTRTCCVQLAHFQRSLSRLPCRELSAPRIRFRSSSLS